MLCNIFLALKLVKMQNFCLCIFLTLRYSNNIVGDMHCISNQEPVGLYLGSQTGFLMELA